MVDTFTTRVHKDDNGEYYIVFPLEIIEQLGWKEGDTVLWSVHDDGTVSISKVDGDEIHDQTATVTTIARTA